MCDGDTSANLIGHTVDAIVLVAEICVVGVSVAGKVAVGDGVEVLVTVIVAVTRIVGVRVGLEAAVLVPARVVLLG